MTRGPMCRLYKNSRTRTALLLFRAVTVDALINALMH